MLRSVAKPVAIVSVTVALSFTIALLKARFVTKNQPSKLLAIMTLGPITSLRAYYLLKSKIMSKFGQSFRGCKSDAEHIASYKPKASDIIVAVPGKSGTTWLMQIAHQLRMRGMELEYDDQMDIMPWLEGGVARVLDQDINMEQVAQPRVFKSHLGWSRLQTTPFQEIKIIYCFRDIKDQLISFWKFLPPFAEAEISCWAFTTGFLLFSGIVDRGLSNLCDFWQHRHDARVCFFFFDDLRERHADCVRRVQQFMDLGVDEDVTQKVIAQSTHEYMSAPAHARKFDDHKIVHAMDLRRGIVRSVPLTGKVRKDGGKSGAGAALPQSVQDWIEWRWRCIVLPRTGFANLSAMRAAWLLEQRR